ncbi:MAG: bifunctional 5,10-methylenetetrahydrofolate dehydrogenase/5,10-methenyltetrahydrofolate cyclohydrolase [Simkaniaceae bacterium]
MTMNPLRLDGSVCASHILEKLKKTLSQLKGRPPTLAFVLVGHDEGSKIYVKMKQKRAIEVGIDSKIIALESNISEEALLLEIKKLNDDPLIDGFLVQQPLPSHISLDKVVLATNPSKDVDGFHPFNQGKLLLGQEDGFISCTPLGIRTLLEHYHIRTESRHVVILGRSSIVGKPLAALLLKRGPFGDATVTIAHSKTKNLSDLTQQADILVAAIGSSRFVKASMIKEGAVVIDVGINREGKRLFGDVDFEEVAPKTSAITPVPKGVGPMTIAMLLQNTYKSYLCRNGDRFSS